MTGDHFLVSHSILLPPELTLPTETMAEHRSKSLTALLPIALATGFSDIDPEHPPFEVHTISIQVVKKSLTLFLGLRR